MAFMVFATVSAPCAWPQTATGQAEQPSADRRSPIERLLDDYRDAMNLEEPREIHYVYRGDQPRFDNLWASYERAGFSAFRAASQCHSDAFNSDMRHLQQMQAEGQAQLAQYQADHRRFTDLHNRLQQQQTALVQYTYNLHTTLNEGGELTLNNNRLVVREGTSAVSGGSREALNSQLQQMEIFYANDFERSTALRRIKSQFNMIELWKSRVANNVTESDLMVLNYDTFSRSIATTLSSLQEYYRTRCGGCSDLPPQNR